MIRGTPRGIWIIQRVQIRQGRHFRVARLYVTIEDDGVGLVRDNSPPMHYGLVIMRDRAETLGGELTLGNRPGGGTRVSLAFTPQTARLISQHVGADSRPATSVDAIATDRYGNRE